MAWRACASVSAATRSARPSTSVRSMRPFSKARRANSPGSASRTPLSEVSASITRPTTARPPWMCSSAMSSPVKLAGPGSQSASPRSSTSPVPGLLILRKLAWRGGGGGPQSWRSASPAPGPEMRMTATPARPGALASAQMVSRWVMEFDAALLGFHSLACVILEAIGDKMTDAPVEERASEGNVSAARRAPISSSTRRTRCIGGRGGRRRSPRPSAPASRSCSRSATPPAIGAT